MPLPTTPYILSTNAWEFITAADYPAMRDFIGIGPTDTLSLANLNTTSASLSASTPFTISQTWNAGSNVMTALKVEATDTASGATSNLLELWSGATPALKLGIAKGGSIISKVGVIAANGTANAAGLSLELFYPLYGLGVDANGNTVFFRNGLAKSRSGLGVATSSDQSIGWTNAGHVGADAILDTILVRDGAPNTLALRNGTAAQTFRVYNTFLGTTASEWFEIDWKTSPGTVRLFATDGGTGVARNIDISAKGTLFFGAGTGAPIRMYTGGLERWNISATGHIIATSDNAYDIGASGATRPRNLYIANSITTGSVMPNSGSDLIFNGASTGAAWKISTAGHFLAFTDNTYDIGASGATRPRNLYVGSAISGSTVFGSTNVVTGDFFRGTRLLLGADVVRIGHLGDGILEIKDTLATGFNKVVFGGGTSSFPSLKRVGTDFQVVLASTTAATNVAAGDADLTFIEDRYRRKGTGDPNGVVTAPVGAVYHRTDGGANTSFYVKETGTDSNGWVGK